jgi:two-component system chemotaxis response regulator CheY
LGDRGYTDIIDARDGDEGLRRLKEEKPDLVLLDLTMPGISGIGVLKEIKTHAPGAKVIIISMTSEPVLREQALELGANAYVAKPLGENLMKQVQALIG